MSRFTKKEKNMLASHGYTECDYLLNGTSRVKALNKLGQLEDTEDKLGVGLNTFVSALTGSYYVKIKFPSGIVRRQRFWGKYTFIDNIDGEWVFVYEEPYYVKLKEYGITWALTKEELLRDFGTGN